MKPRRGLPPVAGKEKLGVGKSLEYLESLQILDYTFDERMFGDIG